VKTDIESRYFKGTHSKHLDVVEIIQTREGPVLEQGWNGDDDEK
jgi:hypothetical protein